MNTVTRNNMKAFLKGFASAFDFSGRILVDLREIPGGFDRDRIMLQRDWTLIGNDIRKGISTVDNEK
jgi:C-terminal processing protease CtpA/Prc